MKPLKFDQSLIESILSGSKTTTWRLFDDKNLSEGDELDCINKQTGESFAHAAITRVFEKPLGEVTDEDYRGHERYTSDQEMYETFSKFYNRPVDKTTLVKIVEFKLVK